MLRLWCRVWTEGIIIAWCIHSEQIPLVVILVLNLIKKLEKITSKCLTDTKCVVILSIIYTEVNYTLSIGCEQE